jgi:hypothetical protein
MRTSSSMIVVIAIVAALVFVAAAALFGFNIVQPAYAPPVTCPNCGASELAPGEEPKLQVGTQMVLQLMLQDKKLKDLLPALNVLKTFLQERKD